MILDNCVESEGKDMSTFEFKVVFYDAETGDVQATQKFQIEAENDNDAYEKLDEAIDKYLAERGEPDWDLEEELVDVY